MRRDRNEDIAFEMLMKGIPNADHFDSGADGICPECRTCRFHRPYWHDRSCVFEECPYEPRLITLKSGKRGMKGGDKNKKIGSQTKEGE